MHRFGRKFKSLVVMVAAVAAFAAMASSASAATFSPSGNIKASTTGLTVKRNGIDPRTCTPEASLGGYVSGGGIFLTTNGFLGDVWFKCSGSTFLELGFAGGGAYDTASARYYVTLATPGHTETSPWGSYTQQVSDPTWVNGSGATKSVLKFEEEPIGNASGTITLTGNLEFTTSSGGLLTLVK